MTLHSHIFQVVVAALALVCGGAALDALVHPRPRHGLRSVPGLVINAGVLLGVFGAILALCGNPLVACALSLGLGALFTVASNAKNTMLGEPLLFSDLALIGAVFRHPQFYLSAVAPWQRAVASLVALALVALLCLLFRADGVMHLAGLALALGAVGMLAILQGSPAFRAIAATPDPHGDVARHGLVPVLLLYWRRWRETRDPPPCPASGRPARGDAPELVVVIQCESFADPADLFDDATLALPGLDAARGLAWQHGRLHVSGFGAYTMRTEYGVLFGREEAELGFRRFDPFLTAQGEGSWALPARLRPAGWDSAFLHPHDMRFYGRDRIMPAGGFARLVGETHFAPPAPGQGRYVTDAAMTDVILDTLQAASAPTLLYAVTIENHGPWAGDGQEQLVPGYMRLVRNSDAMLARLADGLAALARQRGKPAALVFFGDHCPSIPGAPTPAGKRHTPFVIMRFDHAGQPMRGDDTAADLTPAGLHHAILDMMLEPAR